MESMTLLDAVATGDGQRCERDDVDVGGVSYGSRDQVGTMIRENRAGGTIDVMVILWR